jgi:hypothetical protein
MSTRAIASDHVITHSESRKLKPKDENCLECKIPWEVVEDEAERKAFGEVEEAKDNPICEPLDIILMSRGLQSLEGKISG